MQLATQSVFYKQRNNLFFPVSAFTLPTTALRLPYSLIFGCGWGCFAYYVVGFTPEWSRCYSTGWLTPIWHYLRGNRAACRNCRVMLPHCVMPVLGRPCSWQGQLIILRC